MHLRCGTREQRLRSMGETEVEDLPQATSVWLGRSIHFLYPILPLTAINTPRAAQLSPAVFALTYGPNIAMRAPVSGEGRFLDPQETLRVIDDNSQ